MKPPEMNMENGYTIGVYFPKEASPEIVMQMLDRISVLVYGELPEDRGNWDAVVVGHAGDVLRIEHDCECCPPHIYFSTSCHHGDHTYCQRETGLLGNKIPGVCKFCKAPCVCSCHRKETNDSVDGE